MKMYKIRDIIFQSKGKLAHVRAIKAYGGGSSVGRSIAPRILINGIR